MAHGESLPQEASRLGHAMEAACRKLHPVPPMAGFKQALKNNPDLKVELDPVNFTISRKLERDDRLREVLDEDVTIKRIYRERKLYKSRKKEAGKAIQSSEERLRTLKQERRDIQRALRVKEGEIKRAEDTLYRNRDKKNTANQKLRTLRNELTARRTRLMHNAKGILLREAYKDIGLPIPERLKKIKNLAIFKEARNNNDKDNQGGGTHKPEREEG